MPSGQALRSFPVPRAARAHLVCFPNAGGTVAQFSSWPARLPGVQVHAVELPGHGARRASAPLRDMAAVVAEAAPEIAALGPAPVALWGHSMGAAVAYAVARALTEGGGAAPAVLLAAARDAPWSPDFLPRFHAMPDAELWQSMVGFGGTPPEIADHPELRELFLPVLRADLTVVETYRPAPRPPLDCPVHVFTGRSDTLVSAPGLAAWADGTRGAARTHTYRGGHFFVPDNLPALLRRVRALVLAPS